MNRGTVFKTMRENVAPDKAARRKAALEVLSITGNMQDALEVYPDLLKEDA